MIFFLFKKKKTKGVEFKLGDATKFENFNYIHIYCFNKIFNDETNERLLSIIEKSNFKVFICFLSPNKISKFGI